MNRLISRKIIAAVGILVLSSLVWGQGNKGGKLKITTTSLPSGTVGVPYAAMLTATGGIKPYTWTLSNGVLPQGLTLSTSGTISGTPTAIGNSFFTVTVTDANGATHAVSIRFKKMGS